MNTRPAPDTSPRTRMNTPEYMPRSAPARICPAASRYILVGE